MGRCNQHARSPELSERERPSEGPVCGKGGKMRKSPTRREAMKGLVNQRVCKNNETAGKIRRRPKSLAGRTAT